MNWNKRLNVFNISFSLWDILQHRLLFVLANMNVSKLHDFHYASLCWTSGTSFWCLLDIVPIKNEKGEVVLFLFSFKDITDSYGKTHHCSKMQGMALNKTTWKFNMKKVYLYLIVHLFVFIAGISEDGTQNRKSRRSHLSRARERGRSVLYHLTSQFTNRNKGKLANVSYHDDMLIIRLFCLLVNLTLTVHGSAGWKLRSVPHVSRVTSHF